MMPFVKAGWIGWKLGMKTAHCFTHALNRVVAPCPVVARGAGIEVNRQGAKNTKGGMGTEVSLGDAKEEIPDNQNEKRQQKRMFISTERHTVSEN
jgi:hypothetical protein